MIVTYSVAGAVGMRGREVPGKRKKVYVCSALQYVMWKEALDCKFALPRLQSPIHDVEENFRVQVCSAPLGKKNLIAFNDKGQTRFSEKILCVHSIGIFSLDKMPCVRLCIQVFDFHSPSHAKCYTRLDDSNKCLRMFDNSGTRGRHLSIYSIFV